MTTVINQWGMYIDGRVRDEIIHAVETDATSLVIDGTHIKIVKVTTTEDRKIIEVEVLL